MVATEPTPPAPVNQALVERRPLTPFHGLPWVQTLGFTGLAGVIFFALDVGTGAEPLASTEEWSIWRIVSAVGVTTSLGVGVIGLRSFWRLGAKRWLSKCAMLFLAAIFVALVIWFLQSGVAIADRAWPIPDMKLRLTIVVVTIGLATVPWVALVWQVHLDAKDRQAASAFAELVRMWATIRSCVLAFAGFVVIALVQSGALRSLWQARAGLTEAQKDEFTGTDVLLYGGFLALMMAALVIPLLMAWKVQAELLVQDQFPTDHFFAALRDDGWFAARDRLAALLHLDVSIIRNPLTALSIFTPLVTSLLAAFLPELAK